MYLETMATLPPLTSPRSQRPMNSRYLAVCKQRVPQYFVALGPSGVSHWRHVVRSRSVGPRGFIPSRSRYKRW